jgi:signal transduction histidine kinase
MKRAETTAAVEPGPPMAIPDSARELLWTVCHDLANLMSVVRLDTQRLLTRLENGEHPTQDEWTESLKRTDHVALAAIVLMRDVLRAERDEARPSATRERPRLIDFEDTLDEVLAVNAEALAQAGCPVIVSRDGGLDRICGRWDRGSVERLLSNLLQNVARHAAGAPARIHLSTEPGWLRMWFSDGGDGLPSASADFGRRAFVGPAAMEGNHGLGLWIIHRTVAALDGEIEMRNVPGSGLAFEIRLPLSP